MSFGTTVKSLWDVSKAWTINHSPELLLAGGIVAFGATIYLAAKAGSETEEIIEEHKEELDEVKSEEDYTKKEVFAAYGHTGVKLAKKYAPTAACAALSLTCFCASYGILNKRYVALGAAYTALQESYTLYRKRVIDSEGREKDLYYLTGQKPEKIEIENEEGKKEKVKAYIDLPDGSIASPYAFKFGKYKENGERNLQWQDSMNYIRAVVKGTLEYYDDQLYLRSTFDDDHRVIKRGAVFLNEIRTSLGEDSSTSGSIVGNRFGNGEPGCDGYIDGDRIIEAYEIIDGKKSPCIWIDPNVDGIIYDLIDNFEKVPFVPNLRDGFDGEAV